MRQPSNERVTAVSRMTGERDAVLGHWIGNSVGRLLQLRGEHHGDSQPRVRIESVWAALGDRAAPVTIVRWRVEPHADPAA